MRSHTAANGSRTAIVFVLLVHGTAPSSFFVFFFFLIFSHNLFEYQYLYHWPMLPVTVVIDSRRRPRQRQDTPSHLSDYLILCRPHPVLDGQGDWEHCLGAVSRQTVSIGTGRNPWRVSFYKACRPINTNPYFFLLPASDFPIFPSLAT